MRINLIISFIIYVSNAFVFTAVPLFASTTAVIQSLENSKEADRIKQDVRQTISVVRGGKDPCAMPELTFYSYTLKKGDTFWTILYRTSLNVDTLMSVNNLASPYSLKEGDTIYFPNMRGVIHEFNKEKIDILEKRYGVKQQYIFTANKISSLSKKYLFIPCGELSSLERSLFLGTGFAAPLAHLRRTSGFGIRKDPFTGEKSFHTGVDLGCDVRTPVFAARAGKVVFTGYKGDYGQLVILEHPCGYYSYYGHLSQIKVRVGSIVTAQDVIALSGNTGRTTGPHLHFEIRKHSKPINPVIILR
jgi:murein DD-endopeptidase MepM/ murein hydrolase activator NlpD